MLSAKHLQHLPAVAVVLCVSACVVSAVAVGTSYWLVGIATPVSPPVSSTVSPVTDALGNTSYGQTNVINNDGMLKNEILVNGHIGLFQTCADTDYQLNAASYTGSRWKCGSVMRSLHGVDDRVIIHQWKSVIAFELVSTVAIFFDGIIATIGWVKKMPLPTLLAGVTGAMAGLFMMVGHAMFITAHQTITQSQFEDLGEDWQYTWSYGSSFIMAWLGFCLSALGAILDITMFVCSDRYRENDLTAMPV
ncbi:uncharacterized protein LOC144434809 [Glandiceps talaboti]